MSSLFCSLLSLAIGGSSIAQNAEVNLPYEFPALKREIVASGSDIFWELARHGAPERSVFALFSVAGAFSSGDLSERFPQVSGEAIRAIEGIPQHAQVVAERIHTLTGKKGSGRDRYYLFGKLRTVGSPSAIDTIASFLEDDFVNLAEAEFSHASYTMSNAGLAAKILAGMQLPDSPTERWINGSPGEVAKWKVWRDSRAREQTGGNVVSPVELEGGAGQSDQSAVDIDIPKGSSFWLVCVVAIALLGMVCIILTRWRGPE